MKIVDPAEGLRAESMASSTSTERESIATDRDVDSRSSSSLPPRPSRSSRDAVACDAIRESPRTSPDPLSQTDRYRLVTPYTHEL
jgi:hypothetical protein